MLFERIATPGVAHYGYLLGDDGAAVVIDPRRDVDVYIDRAHAEGMRIARVLETHRNEDLVTGSAALAERTGADVLHSGHEEFDYGYGKPIHHGDEVRCGSLRLVALHTPGHTPGHLAYVLYDGEDAPWAVFSGDALFAGDVGRTDLMGEARHEEMTRQLYYTLSERIVPLGDGLLLCPAHGKGSVCGAAIADRPWTTIGIERARNPGLQHGDEQQFVKAHARSMGRPPYFVRMEEMNRSGTPFRVPPSPPPIPVGKIDRRLQDLQLIDVRSTLAFATAHVPGALSLWRGNIASYAGWFVDADRPIVLVGDRCETDEAALQLHRLGFDNVHGTLAGGVRAWHASGRDSASVATVTTAELQGADLREELILDVRTDEEVASEPMGPSMHLPLTQLPERIDELPAAGCITIFCGTGLRSMIAASLLRRAGRRDVQVALGGEHGWSSSEPPGEPG